MQTLGLDGSPPPQPWYKLWLWPEVTEPEDAVSAARNGAFAAAAIGVLTCVLGGLSMGAAALFDGVFFLLAAIGIRQLSFPASGMALAIYAISQLVALKRGAMPGVLGLALSFLLIGAARASWRALQMSAEDRAMMANDSPLETWTQRAFQQMGSPVWRRIRVVFNVVLFLYFALLLTGMILVANGFTSANPLP